MAYTAWSVVFGEQPTAAKWNQLGANDAGFKDGTNIDNLAIITRHINTNAVTGDKLATNAIILGKSIITTTVTQSGATPATVATVTVTVPAGGRDLLLIISAAQLLPADLATRTEVDFKESSTVLRRYYHNTSGSGEVFYCYINAPSAGSHTYTVVSTRDAGSGTVQWYADNTSTPAKIEFLALLI